MSPVAALALTLGVALLVAALVIAFAGTHTTPTDQPAVAHLRAADALDGLRPGHDDQWTGVTTLVPHIRNLAAAEDAVTKPPDPH